MTIELRRHHVPTLGGRLAVQSFAKDKVLVHYQIETPAEFAPLPARPFIVVLLDDSRSMKERDQWASAAAIRQVLSLMRDAQVSVLAFSRHVRPITKGFVPATNAIAKLADYAYQRDNGSAVDEALAKADALLAKTPAGSVRRVYVLSDLATRRSLDPLKLRAAFKRSHAVAHIATIREGDPQLEPKEDTPWSKVARATTGLAWTASASTESHQLTTLARVFEEWVHPTRLFHWKMTEPDLHFADAVNANDDFDWANELPTGIAIARLGIAARKIDSLEVQGELWSRKVSATLKPDGGQANVWSALSFRSSVTEGLPDQELMVLAKRGRAVSPVTSYLAIEPGVRPSTEGLEEAGNVLGGLVGNAIGEAYGIGDLGLGGGQAFDHHEALNALLARAWATCGGGEASASLTLENTKTEVVDVSAVKAPSKALARCLQEATWRFELPNEFSAIGQESWDLSVN